MKAIILSAGQGTRLLPLTAEIPKCAISIHGQTVLEWQIDELMKSGVDDIVVVTGFATDKVEQLLARRYDSQRVRTIFNPFYKVSDNLATCWIVRGEMTEDFILINGDTLFDTSVLKALLGSKPQPITVTATTSAAPARPRRSTRCTVTSTRVICASSSICTAWRSTASPAWARRRRISPGIPTRCSSAASTTRAPRSR